MTDHIQRNKLISLCIRPVVELEQIDWCQPQNTFQLDFIVSSNSKQKQTSSRVV